MNTIRQLSPQWHFVADTVMGGVSTGSVVATTVRGRPAHRLIGNVSLENDGGFVQMAFDLDDASEGETDPGNWTGLVMDVSGNGETYEVRLRTSQLTKPWQSFRAEFVADNNWTTIHLPFAAFEAHRHDHTFDPTQLRRIGVLAIGREFHADVSVSDIGFYH